MQIHVDPLGGWSGDMFVAACLDAFPDLWPAVERAISGLRLGPQAACRLVPHNDGVLTGSRFLVAAEDHAHRHEHPHEHHHDREHGHNHDHVRHRDPAPHDDHHHDDHPHDHSAEAHGPAHHDHRAWADIRALIRDSSLAPAVAERAMAIFAGLAEAEGRVHGIPAEDVRFHEVGAVDSIVDIVAASQLIEGIGATRWTASPLPLGGGRVRTAHGWLPVPAPATAQLLRGLETLDDGIAGERVTPTGAAIARHLLAGQAPSRQQPRKLRQSGTGFGTRTLPGLSNCLRVLALEESSAAEGPAPAFAHRELGVVTFEVDDQSAEDLSHGLDHIREVAGIHDVVQSVAYGKKGRMATHVQVLVAPEHLETAIAACFRETTTIGLRFHLVHGAALPRRFAEVDVGGKLLRVKSVTRPDGTVTGKTEAADVAAEPGHASRDRLRREAAHRAVARLSTETSE